MQNLVRPQHSDQSHATDTHLLTKTTYVIISFLQCTELWDNPKTIYGGDNPDGQETLNLLCLFQFFTIFPHGKETYVLSSGSLYSFLSSVALMWTQQSPVTFPSWSSVFSSYFVHVPGICV